MRAIDAVLAHRKSLGTLFLDVPEWLIDGKPMRIFYQSITLAERERLAQYDGPEVDAAILMLKAMDQQGQPLFDLNDMLQMKVAGDGGVISRVALVLASSPTLEQAAKNSLATAS